MTTYWVSWRVRPNAELRERGFATMTERELFIAAVCFGCAEIVERWEK